MRFYKLRVTADAADIASTFNEQFQPDIIPESSDSFRVDWIQQAVDEVLVGEKVIFSLF
jgi:actin-related protein 8